MRPLFPVSNREDLLRVVQRLHLTAEGEQARKIIEGGDLAEVKAGIADGMWIGRKSAVTEVLQRGRPEIAALLLDAGAPVDKGCAAQAVRLGDAMLLKAVLRANANADQALSQAACSQQLDCVRVALDQSPRPDMKVMFEHVRDAVVLRQCVALDRAWKAHDAQTDLVKCAIKSANLAGLEVASEAGFRADWLSFESYLDLPSGFPLKDRAAFLEGAIAMGARPRQMNDQNLAALDFPLSREDAWVPKDRSRRVSALLRAGADAGRFNVMGTTALHRACLTGDAPCVDLLIDAGARLMQRCNRGNTPLMEALKEGELTVFQAMLARTVDREPLSLLMGDSSGLGLLQFAVTQAKTTMNAPAFVALLDAGMDPDLPDAAGWTARTALARRSSVNNKAQLQSILDSHTARCAAQGALEQITAGRRTQP